MLTLELDMYQACALGALVYCLGRLLVQKLPFLSKYCIPAPVAGGVVFAFAHLALYATGVLELSFDTTLQSVFMTIFFCSVGFTACFRLLKKGGVQVFMFLALAVGICIVQDAVGSGLAAAFGLNPLLGLCMGSMPLVGGHGTSGSFGPLLEQEYAVVGATTVALASATYGLVSGSMMGGPIARARVEKHHLKSTAAEEGNAVDEVASPIEENFQYTAQDPTFNRARWIAGMLLERYLSGDLDEIHVLYTRMENVMQSVAKDKRVLPITKPDMHGMAIPVDVRLEEFSLRPTPEEAMNAIVPNYVAGFIYGALVESFCSEQNARMMAMDAATDNADALLKDLNTMYNRARQAAITQEITEVCGGAAAQRREREEEMRV